MFLLRSEYCPSSAIYLPSSCFFWEVNTVPARQYIYHLHGNLSLTVMWKTLSLYPVLNYFNPFHILFLKTFLHPILINVQRDATQSSLFIILQVHSTCFGCQPHPSSGVLKTPSNVANLATLEGGSCTKNMTSTGGCSYSFMYSWWWVWLTPETCRVNMQNNKWTALCCISLGNY